MMSLTKEQLHHGVQILLILDLIVSEAKHLPIVQLDQHPI